MTTTEKTNTVWLAELESGFANVPNTYRVADGPDDYADEVDRQETTREYALPAGYHVAESNMGTMEIYDENGDHCELYQTTRGGNPALPKLYGAPVVLKRVTNNK